MCGAQSAGTRSRKRDEEHGRPVNVTAGVAINLVGDTISMPFFIRTKAWDVVAMISFMTFVSVSKLLSSL